MYAAAGGASIASRRKQKRRSREEQLIRRQRQLQQIQQIQQLVQQQRRSGAVGSSRAPAQVRAATGAPRSLLVGGQQQAVRQSSPLPGAPLLVPGPPVRCCSPYGHSPHGRAHRQRQRENDHRERHEEARKHERHETRRSQPPLSRERIPRSHHHRHRPGVFYERSPATDCHSHRHFRTREPPERETFFPRCRATESDDRFVFSSSCDKDDDDGDENEEDDDDDDDDGDADDDNGDRDKVGKGKDDHVGDCTHFRRDHPDDSDDDDGDFDGNDDDDGDSRARSVVDSRLSTSNSDPRCGGAQTAGKAAWQGCNKKRGSPLTLAHGHPPHTCRESDGYSRTKQCEAHRRWMKKRNRIRDASHCYYGSTDDEEDYDYDDDDDEDDERINRNRRRGEVSAAVNTVLYAGLGTTALGLVISFVGTGEKGFLSTELKLLGPSLLCAGLLCCFLRVLLCVCGHQCGCRRFLRRRMEKKKGDAKSKKAPASNRPQQQTGRGPLPIASSQASTLPTTTLHLSPIRYPRKDTKQKQGSQAHSMQSQPSSTLQQQQQQHPPPHTYQSQQTEQFQLNQQQHHEPQKQPVTPAVKGHELLLSPAQLPE